MKSRSTWARSGIWGLMFVWGAVYAGGCSVYHRAETQLPTDPHERLALRVTAARDAAAAGLHALESAAPAEPAETASWDLDKAVASVGDVLARTSENDEAATALKATLDRAAVELGSAVDMLGRAEVTDASPAVDRAREALSAAVAQADAFLNRGAAR